MENTFEEGEKSCHFFDNAARSTNCERISGRSFFYDLKYESRLGIPIRAFEETGFFSCLRIRRENIESSFELEKAL